MADSVIRLRVNSDEYDNKLKRAAEGLNRYIDGCRKAGGTLEHVDDGVKEFTQQLGKMETVAGGAKGKLGEMTKAFTDLTMQFNKMTEAEKNGQFGKALSAGLDEMKQRIISTKKELADINSSLSGRTSGGGLFGGDKISGMLQVFGGNLLTKAAGMVANFAMEMGDAVKQGIELAKAGEGIRIAFDRLDQPGLLDNLREATHGTVTNIELMKAAVKFNDFKLPIEELGTMLAFAQQKAKDTGQSVDYMVDSIVTGLGRKSLMILDNLGLSANEVKDKMKETGDMTKAVGAIIREQMAKAGDYVETTADRATKADVDLKNAMEDLGRTFQPLTDASNDLWSSIKTGALNALNNAVRPLINALTEAGRIRNQYDQQNGGGRVNRMLGRLSDIQTSSYRQGTYKAQLSNFDTKISSYQQYLADYKKWQSDKTAVGAYDRMQAFQKQTGLSVYSDVKEQLDVFKRMRTEYVNGAKSILADIPAPSPASNDPKNNTKGGGGKNDPTYAEDSIAAMEAEVSTLTKLWKEAGAAVRDEYKAALDEATLRLNEIIGKSSKIAFNSEQAAKMVGFSRGVNTAQTSGLGSINTFKNYNITGLGDDFEKLPTSNIENMTEALKQQQMAFNLAGQAAQNFGAALASIEDPGAKAAGTVVSAIASIAMGFAMASSNANTAGTGWGWLAWLAAGMSAMATTIATIHSLTGYAEGGIVKGNSYSGDNIMANGGTIGLNAGELILNRSQQNSIANQLEGNGIGNLNLHGVLQGENILISIDRTLQRQGRELAVWGRGGNG